MKITLVIFLSFVLAILVFGFGERITDYIKETAQTKTIADVIPAEKLKTLSSDELKEFLLDDSNLALLSEANKKRSADAQKDVNIVFGIQILILLILAYLVKIVVTKMLRKQKT